MKKATYREIPALLAAREPFTGNSVKAIRSGKNNEFYTVISYETAIYRDCDGELMLFDSKYYSSTTSKLQNIMRRVFNLK